MPILEGIYVLRAFCYLTGFVQTSLTSSSKPSRCSQPNSNLHWWLSWGFGVPVDKRIWAWSDKASIRSKARTVTMGRYGIFIFPIGIHRYAIQFFITLVLTVLGLTCPCSLVLLRHSCALTTARLSLFLPVSSWRPFFASAASCA